MAAIWGQEAKECQRETGGSEEQPPLRLGGLAVRGCESHSNRQQGLGLAFSVCKYQLLFSKLQGETEGSLQSLFWG